MAKINMTLANESENVSNGISQFLLLEVQIGSITLENRFGLCIKDEDIYILYFMIQQFYS